jgi:hypothetical protein
MVIRNSVCKVPRMVRNSEYLHSGIKIKVIDVAPCENSLTVINMQV